jgi:uncharacterized protein YcnI
VKSSTLPTRALAISATACAAALLGASSASAHVHATPDTTAADGYSVVTFRVPNESDTAATTSVEVSLPTDHPFSYVAVRPVSGWNAVVTEGALPEPVEHDGATLTQAALTITWTAEPGTPGIAVGQFEEFEANVGPLPEAGTRVVLPTVQTYGDGEVSSWTEVADEGAEEPESPAPEFTTTSPSDDEHAVSGHEAAPTTDPAPTPGGSGADPLARGLAGGGLVLGLAALVLVLLRRQRS